MQEIGKFGRKSLIMVKSEISQNLSLQNTFQRMLLNSFNTTSNEKVANQKVIENFLGFVLDIKFVPKGQGMLPERPNYCEALCSFGTPKVGDGFDSNSFHTWIFWPNHDLGSS